MGEVQPAQVDGILESRDVRDAAIAGVEAGERGQVARHDRPHEVRRIIKPLRRRNPQCVGDGQPQALVGDDDLAVERCLRLRERILGGDLEQAAGCIERLADLGSTIGVAGRGRVLWIDICDIAITAVAAREPVEVGPADEQIVARAAQDRVAIVELVAGPGAAGFRSDEVERVRQGTCAGDGSASGVGREHPQVVAACIEMPQVGGEYPLLDGRAGRIEEVEGDALTEGSLWRDRQTRVAGGTVSHSQPCPAASERPGDVEREAVLRHTVGPRRKVDSQCQPGAACKQCIANGIP